MSFLLMQLYLYRSYYYFLKGLNIFCHTIVMTRHSFRAICCTPRYLAIEFLVAVRREAPYLDNESGVRDVPGIQCEIARCRTDVDSFLKNALWITDFSKQRARYSMVK